MTFTVSVCETATHQAWDKTFVINFVEETTVIFKPSDTPLSFSNTTACKLSATTPTPSRLICSFQFTATPQPVTRRARRLIGRAFRRAVNVWRKRFKLNSSAPYRLLIAGLKTAFIDNADDAKLLREREDDFAKAIARGVTDYFANDKPLPDVITCHCCGRGSDKIASRLIELLEQLRAKANAPIHINCAYRCPKHNAEVGGVPNSQHVVGTAADIYPRLAYRMVGMKLHGGGLQIDYKKSAKLVATRFGEQKS